MTTRYKRVNENTGPFITFTAITIKSPLVNKAFLFCTTTQAGLAQVSLQQIKASNWSSVSGPRVHVLDMRGWIRSL